MIEKMNIFDVEIPILTAKEAMIRAMQYLESESVDTIELVSMDMLMKERENAQWKEQINALTMLLPENTEILKAAEIENEKLFRETEENVFLKMFMKYMNTGAVQSVFSGLRPAVVGLLAAATLLLMTPENFSTPIEHPWQFWISVGLFIATFVGTKYMKINPIRMILYSAFAGLLLLY